MQSFNVCATDAEALFMGESPGWARDGWRLRPGWSDRDRF